jgi:hypothetical protein
MLVFYKKLLSTNPTKPTFKLDIEDVCDEKLKPLFQFDQDESKKDRSNTFHGVYDFKSCFIGDKRMSCNNPLSDLGKFK